MDTTITQAVVDDFGRKVKVNIQRTHEGDHWATTGKQNSDKGYTLLATGSAVKQTYKNGDLISSVKVGTWHPVEETADVTLCGHTASGNGFTYICDLSEGHTGLHRQRLQLRDSVSTTNWGDDGLSMYATKFPENGSYSRPRR